MTQRSANISQERYLRVYWLLIGYLLVLLLIWGSLDPNPMPTLDFSGSDKFEHAFAYGFLLLWFGQVYKTTRARWRILLSLMILGCVLEIAQGAGGYRYFELTDLLADCMGLLLGRAALALGADRILAQLEDSAGPWVAERSSGHNVESTSPGDTRRTRPKPGPDQKRR